LAVFSSPKAKTVALKLSGPCSGQVASQPQKTLLMTKAEKCHQLTYDEVGAKTEFCP
jgi:hypothetical protein